MENNIYNNPNNPYKKPEQSGDSVYVSPAQNNGSTEYGAPAPQPAYQNPTAQPTVAQTPYPSGVAQIPVPQPIVAQPVAATAPIAYKQVNYTPPVSPTEVVLTEEQKEARRKDLNKMRWSMVGIGAVMIIVFIIMRNWRTPFISIAQLLGVADTDLLILFDNDYFKKVVQIVISTFCFTVPFIILAKVRRKSISELIPLGRPKEGTALPFFMFGLSLCALSNIFTSYFMQAFESFLGMFGLKYNLPVDDSEKGILMFFLAAISTAVIPGLVEEFGCRGVMFGLLKEHSEGFAILVSALLFGIMHGNFVQIPFAFIVGLALAVIRLKTGTLWIAIAVHFCNNFISVLFNYALFMLPKEFQSILSLGHLASSIFLGVLGVVMIAKRSPKTFSLNFNKNGVSEFKLIRNALIMPTVAIAIALYLIEALSYIS